VKIRHQGKRPSPYENAAHNATEANEEGSIFSSCLPLQLLDHLQLQLATNLLGESVTALGIWQTVGTQAGSPNVKMSSSPPIYRPAPRRPFEHASIPQQPPSPLLSPARPDETPSRTHSIMNLTSSTLLGIYSPTGYSEDRDEPSTPWGTGAETPNPAVEFPTYRKKSAAPLPPVPSGISTVLSLGIRSITLFGLGMLYGLLVRHLHDDQQLAPFQVEGIIKPRNDWRYLAFWGVAGVALGSLLPWVDTLWEDNFESPSTLKGVREGTPEKEEELNSSGLFGADWTPVIRSVGAFVGIAFAIRKLPWTSTLQASLTLALVNPVLWYIIDRSKPGFILSTAVGFTGTGLLLVSNPNIMPSPASSPKNSTIQHQNTVDDFGRYISRENIEGGIWIMSVLFCSCVCFGNVGRRLALNTGIRERVLEKGFSHNGNGHGNGKSSRGRVNGRR